MCNHLNELGGSWQQVEPRRSSVRQAAWSTTDLDSSRRRRGESAEAIRPVRVTQQLRRSASGASTRGCQTYQSLCNIARSGCPWGTFVFYLACGIFKKAAIRSSVRQRSPTSHSQIVSTSHPSARSRFSLSRSRLRFRRSFDRQYSTRVLGTWAWAQPRCWCQKQPWTWMIFRSRGKTKSGLPGREWTC